MVLVEDLDREGQPDLVGSAIGTCGNDRRHNEIMITVLGLKFRIRIRWMLVLRVSDRCRMRIRVELIEF